MSPPSLNSTPTPPLPPYLYLQTSKFTLCLSRPKGHKQKYKSQIFSENKYTQYSILCFSFSSFPSNRPNPTRRGDKLGINHLESKYQAQACLISAWDLALHCPGSLLCGGGSGAGRGLGKDLEESKIKTHEHTFFDELKLTQPAILPLQWVSEYWASGDLNTSQYRIDKGYNMCPSTQYMSPPCSRAILVNEYIHATKLFHE